jgi:hypothetical protein
MLYALYGRQCVTKVTYDAASFEEWKRISRMMRRAITAAIPEAAAKPFR